MQSRKQIITTIEAIDEQIEVLQQSKRETYDDHRNQMTATEGKEAARLELDALKKAVQRRRQINKHGIEVVEERDALVEEILAEVDNAPRATRSASAVPNHSSDLRNMVPEHDPETGEVFDDHSPDLGKMVETHPRHGACGAEDEAAVATVAAPSSAQLNQAETPNEAAGELVAPELDAADHGPDGDDGGASAEGLSAGGENVADRPVHVSEEPGRGAASVNAPAEGDTHSATIPHPVEGTTPTSTADGDRGAVLPSAATVVPSNVTTFRTHNPETHFLNSEGLPRLHGCQKGEMCGSAEPRKRLCFPCSVAHDGPTPQVEGGAA